MFPDPLVFLQHLMRFGTPGKRHHHRRRRQRDLRCRGPSVVLPGSEGAVVAVVAAQTAAATEDGGVVDHGARCQLLPKVCGGAQHHLQPMVETMDIS